MVACQHGNVQCAAALISWGADASKERDRRGRLPVHLVAQSGRMDVMQLLLGLSPSLQPSPPPVPLPQMLPRAPSRLGEEANRSMSSGSASSTQGAVMNGGSGAGGSGRGGGHSPRPQIGQLLNKSQGQQQRITDYSRYCMHSS
jgi:ankyrin repeat protein